MGGDWRRTLRPVVFVACLIPLAMLLGRGVLGELGANPIEALTRGLGDWALRFLVITLAVTPVRRLTGLGVLASYRRMLGLFAFFYASLHLASYVALDQFFDWQAIGRDIVKRRYITVGMMTFALLLPLALTSTKAMIRHLGSKRWQSLHRLVYGAGVAAVLHYFFMVKADTRQPLIYGGIVAVLLGARVLAALPLRRTAAVMVLALVSAPASAEVPTSRAQIGLSFAPIVKQVAPAVVNIYTRRVVRSEGRVSPLIDDPIFRHFFGDRLGIGAPSERVEKSLGSGVIVRPGGVVVTNRHVIKDSDAVTVVLADRREFEAKIVGVDERTDLAVLKIDLRGEPLPVVPLANSDELEVGDVVLAIGNPFGIGQTVTSGIVSALARTTVGISDYRFFIQTDAAINPGNSGGALVTASGALAGINTAIYSQAGGNVGVGFAIPANMVRAVVDGILTKGHVIHPWIGATLEDVTPDIAETLGLPRPTGALVTAIRPRSPAEAAGLRPGDVVVAVNGHEVGDPEAMRFRIATLPIGSNAEIKALRRGSALALALKLMAPPETPPRDLTEIAGLNPFSGAVLANINPALAEESGIDAELSGVIIVQLKRNSLAYRVNLRPGDIILEVNGEKIGTVDTLARLVVKPVATWQIAVQRGGSVMTLTVKG